MQEKILAPRTLHCGDQGFFWECRTHIASDYFPDGYTEANHTHRFSTVLLEKKNLWAQWRSIKEWYTRCDLTKSEDKLIALPGIVQEIKDKTKDQYLAGLWRKWLEEELCWRASAPRPRPIYRAPSWSWAAVDGPVTTKLIKRPILETVHAVVGSVSVIHPSGNTLGAVIHGTLSLVCDLILSGTIAAEHVAKEQRKSYQVRHLLSPDEERGVCFSSLGQEGLVFPFLFDCTEQKDSRLGQTVYYLPLRNGGNGIRFYGGDGSLIQDQRVFGLVLEEASGASNRYKRIGCFEYSTPAIFEEGDDDNKCSFPEDYDNFMELSGATLSSNIGRLAVQIV